MEGSKGRKVAVAVDHVAVAVATEAVALAVVLVDVPVARVPAGWLGRAGLGCAAGVRKNIENSVACCSLDGKLVILPKRFQEKLIWVVQVSRRTLSKYWFYYMLCENLLFY